MADLPGQVPERISVSEHPRSQITSADVESPYERLGAALDKTGHALEDVSVHLAEQAGMKAVTRDAQGNIQVEQAPIIGPAAIAYRRAVNVAYAAEMDGAAKRKDIELRQQFRDDPEGYQKAAEAYRRQAQADAGRVVGPEAATAIGQTIESTTTLTYRGLLNEKERLDLQRAEGSIKAQIASAEDDATALARGGASLDTPQLQQAVRKVQMLRGELVGNPRLAYSNAQAQFDNEHFLGQIGANRFLHQVDDVYKQGPDADTRARNALDFAKSILTDPSLKLTEQQRQGYFHQAVSEIRASEAQRKQDISEWRAAESELKTATLLGIDLDPQRVDDIYRGYQKLGATREAMGLLAWEARAPLGKQFGRMPLPDQLNTLHQLEGQALPSGYMQAIKASEGFDPVARWDIKQNTVGYGTRALYPGERITRDEAERRFNREISNAASIVDQVNPNLPAGVRAALTSLTFNAGDDWTRSELGARVKAGDIQGARERFLQYTQAGGQTNPALVTRRQQEAQWFGGDVPRETPNTTPSVATAYQQNIAKHLQSETTQAWGEIWKEWREKGTRPSDEMLFNLADAARSSGNDTLLDTMRKSIAIMDQVQQAAQGPLAGQEAAIAELRRSAAAGQGGPGETEFRAEMERRYEQITRGLAEDAPATVAANFPDRFKVPAPLDLSNDQALMAGLAMRGQMASFAAANWQTRAPSALGRGDLAAVQGLLEGGSAADKSRIFGAIVQAIPDEQVRNATLAKIGEKGGAGAVAMWAGGLMRQAPDVSQSILRGQDAIKADPRFAPKGPAEETAWEQSLDRMLPAATFSLEGRTTPGGSYDTVKGAVKAVYADLSARQNDTSGQLNKTRLQTAIDAVTGGVLTHNGGSLIAPSRGMTQMDLDRVLAGIDDRDLAGASTLAGQPLTADYLRRSAKLESAGDGRYRVLLGNDPMRPIYAVAKPEMGAPLPFILDLRNRRPGTIAPTSLENASP